MRPSPRPLQMRDPALPVLFGGCGGVGIRSSLRRSRDASQPCTRPAPLPVLPDPKGRCRRHRTQGRLLRARAGEPPLDVCFPLASSEAETREPGISQPGRCRRAPANHLRPGTSSRLPRLPAQRGTWKSYQKERRLPDTWIYNSDSSIANKPSRRAAEQERKVRACLLIQPPFYFFL